MTDLRVKKPSGKSSTPAASTALSSLSVPLHKPLEHSRRCCCFRIVFPCTAHSKPELRLFPEPRHSSMPIGPKAPSRFQVAGAATADRGWCWTDAGSDVGGCKLAGHRVGCGGADDCAGEDRMLDGYRWTGRDVGGMLVGGGVGGGGLCGGAGDSVGGNRSCAV